VVDGTIQVIDRREKILDEILVTILMRFGAFPERPPSKILEVRLKPQEPVLGLLELEGQILLRGRLGLLGGPLTLPSSGAPSPSSARSASSRVSASSTASAASRSASSSSGLGGSVPSEDSSAGSTSIFLLFFFGLMSGASP
jgi:hypothetical protein